MIARTPLTRTIGLAILAVFLLLLAAMMVRTWQGGDTVLLTWPPFWDCALAFLAGATAAGFMVEVLARPPGENPLRHLLGGLGCIVFGGVIAVVVLCWAVEAIAFGGEPIAIEQAEFQVVHVDLVTRGFNSGKATLSVANHRGDGGTAVPVPREFFDRLGGFRYNGNARRGDGQCLTLHVQRSGDMIRVVLFTPDGGEYPPELHECSAGFTTPS